METHSETGNGGVRKLLGSFSKTFTTVGIFSFFINLIMLVPPLYMLQIYDRVMTSRSQETLLLLTLVLIWMFVTMGVLDVMRSRILVRMSSRLDDKLSQELHRSMLQHSLQNPGKSTQQPATDLMTVRQFLSGNGTFAFFDSPWIPVYIAVLFLFDPAFGWFALFAALTLGVLAVINEFSTRRLQAEAASKAAGASMMLDAQLRNAEVIRAMGMHSVLQKRWLERHLNSIKSQAEVADRAGTWMNLSKTLRLAFQSLMLGLGAYLAINNQITPGMVIAGSIILGRALAPIDQMIGTWKSFIATRLAYRRLKTILANKSESRQITLPDPQGSIEVDRAVLVPPGGNRPVVKGVSLSLRPGEMLAIVGGSAAGKSSLVRAILGLWPLTSGTVRLDGADIRHWNPENVGSRIGYLPQDVELFDGTVAENIARFGELDSKKIVKAARAAGVDGMIRRLPDGYATQIGQGGVALSGGQRQRIGLARALYGKPKVVVLDEPNSNLDEKGEWALWAACNYLKKRGTTLILVSHRKRILRLADKVLLLDDGLLKLYGPRNAVLERMYGRVKVAPAQRQPLHVADAQQG